MLLFSLQLLYICVLTLFILINKTSFVSLTVNIVLNSSNNVLIKSNSNISFFNKFRNLLKDSKQLEGS